MSEPIQGSGPAFPMGYHPEGNSADQFGMTLRDYFAAKALPVLLNVMLDGTVLNKDETAQACFEMADAMIERRNK